MRGLWNPGRFTDPRNHDPNGNFMYLIHEIDAGSGRWVDMLLADPQLVRGNFRICSTLINQDFIGTYLWKIGFIISAPQQNIGPMHYEDMATGRTDSYEGAIRHYLGLTTRFKTWFYTPEGLLRATRDNKRGYNEVDILGTNESTGTQVTTVGISLNCKDFRKLFGKKVESHLWNPATEPGLVEECLKGTGSHRYVPDVERLGKSYPVVFFSN